MGRSQQFRLTNLVAVTVAKYGTRKERHSTQDTKRETLNVFFTVRTDRLPCISGHTYTVKLW